MHLVSLIPLLLAAAPLASARLSRAVRQEQHHALARRAPNATTLEFANIADAAMAVMPPAENPYFVTKNGSATVVPDGASPVGLFEESKMVQKTVKKSHRSHKKHHSHGKHSGSKKTAPAAAPAAPVAPKMAAAPKAQVVPVVAAAKKAPAPAADVPKPKTNPGTTPAPSPAALGGGLFTFVSSNCGPSGATTEHPNGSEEFLACGISKSNPSGGWTPPNGVLLSDMRYVTLEQALAGNQDFSPCEQFFPIFQKYGDANGIPPIVLAAFAMQESTCNPNASGDNGGAFGLMQITQDKCGGRSGADCAAPDYNVATAAAYFRSLLNSSGNNVLVAMGQYNGWTSGMSYNSATAAAYSSCCVCQNNLDYLFQMVNGWMQGKSNIRGSFNNLAVCGNQ